MFAFHPDDTQPLSLINNSPRVNGNMIVAEFTTGDTVINITCHVAGAPDPTPQDCEFLTVTIVISITVIL